MPMDLVVILDPSIDQPERRFGIRNGDGVFVIPRIDGFMILFETARYILTIDDGFLIVSYRRRISISIDACRQEET